jgi:hypothetical protein
LGTVRNHSTLAATKYRQLRKRVRQDYESPYAIGKKQ